MKRSLVSQRSSHGAISTLPFPWLHIWRLRQSKPRKNCDRCQVSRFGHFASVHLLDVRYRTNRLTCATLQALWLASSMLRRLEDRIRELSAKALPSEDSTQLSEILGEVEASLGDTSSESGTQ